ncbi:serine-rich adhesin for platelets, partial [Biomphalaria glabrata]
MTTVAAPSELPDVPECQIDSQTSVDDRRMRWVEFFDREKYLQHVLLMRSRQFSA